MKRMKVSSSTSSRGECWSWASLNAPLTRRSKAGDWAATRAEGIVNSRLLGPMVKRKGLEDAMLVGPNVSLSGFLSSVCNIRIGRRNVLLVGERLSLESGVSCELKGHLEVASSLGSKDGV